MRFINDFDAIVDTAAVAKSLILMMAILLWLWL